MTRADLAFRTFIQSRVPTIKGWNRLEGRPRNADLDKSLAFEICDGLWMLTRQLQMGELTGEDAGSPVAAKIMYSTTGLDQVRLGEGPVEPFDDRLPLETRAERLHPPIDLRFGLEGGRLWRMYLKNAIGAGTVSRDYTADFLAAYPVERPANGPSGADTLAYQQVYELYAAAAGRAIDGHALYTDARQGNDILGRLATPPQAADAPVLISLLDAWYTALRARYALDGHSEGGAWRPSALEYDIACSAPGFDGGDRTALTAEAYSRGHLDWYSFDLAPAGAPLSVPLPQDDKVLDNPVVRTVETFVPTVVSFPGMPAARLWEFESRKTNFGKITAHTTDISRLVFIEFGLVYGNDWYLFPLETEAGRLVRIDGLIVTDTFGERIWIPAYSQSPGKTWQRWVAYANADPSGSAAERRMLFMADALTSVQESAPQERVALFRDEVANMVFGVENRITLDDGRAVDGYEAYQARRSFLERFAPPPVAPDGLETAKIAYRLTIDNVPENWIPFVPVAMPGGNNREIQLQRAALLSKSWQVPAEKVPPRTQILSPPGPYFVHEEEVPRTGIEIVQTYQRTRHHSGRPVVWCGRSKRIGRGEGSSGLAFDRIVERK